MPRHAVYFAPAAAHPLWSLGCQWLGREVDGRSSAAGPARAEVSSPWRYGFHATLKAPLQLREGVQAQDWLQAVHRLAARHRPFMLPDLQVSRLADFLVLGTVQPVGANHPLRRLADDCVLLLDLWRAPASAAEEARRAEGLQDTAQRHNLALWGYPHVFKQWRFHMTLSNSLSAAEASHLDDLQAAAQQHFAAALRQPLACEHLCVFVEPGPGQPFELHHRIELGQP